MLSKRTDLVKEMSLHLETLIDNLSNGISNITDDFNQDQRLSHLHCIEQQIGTLFSSISSVEDETYQIEMSKAELAFLLTFITDGLDLMRMGSSSQYVLDKQVMKTESFINDLIGQKDAKNATSCHDLMIMGRHSDLQSMIASGITHRVIAGDHDVIRRISSFMVNRIKLAYDGNHLVSALNDAVSDIRDRSEQPLSIEPCQSISPKSINCTPDSAKASPDTKTTRSASPEILGKPQNIVALFPTGKKSA